jgi:hypothetical protein
LTTKVYSKPAAKTTTNLPILYQTCPKLGNKLLPGSDRSTLFGFLACARRDVARVLQNERNIRTALLNPSWQYPYCGTLKAMTILSVKEVKALWKRLYEGLRKAGVVAHWVLEVAKTNKVDWHLIIRSCPANLMENGGAKLKNLLRPLGGKVPLNMQFEELKFSYKWANYIHKNKIAGCVGSRFASLKSFAQTDVDAVLAASPDAKYTDDVYASKRVLFCKGTGLKKCGKIGDFWQKKIKVMKDEAKAFRLKRQESEAATSLVAEVLADLYDLDLATTKKTQAELWERSERSTAEREELSKSNREIVDNYYLQPAVQGSVKPTTPAPAPKPTPTTPAPTPKPAPKRKPAMKKSSTRTAKPKPTPITPAPAPTPLPATRTRTPTPLPPGWMKRTTTRTRTGVPDKIRRKVLH